MREVVDGFTTPDGLRLRVATSGDGSPTLVLVHGWSQDLRTWDRVLADLRAAGVTTRVLRYDLPGHGGSPVPDPDDPASATLGRGADDLAALLRERVPTGPIVLAGHSMGGMSLIALAERHPELVASRVAAVAFVGTASDEMADLSLGVGGRLGTLVAHGEHVVLPWMGRLGHRLPRAAVGGPTHRRAALIAPFVRALVFGHRPRAADVLSVADQALAADTASLVAFRASMAEHRRTPTLAALRSTPAVVLVGDRDRLCPVPRARTIAASLPEAEFVLLPGAGHMINLERSTEVAAHIRGLLLSAAASIASADRELARA